MIEELIGRMAALLESLSAKIAALRTPGQVLLKLAAGFGVRLPAA